MKILKYSLALFAMLIVSVMSITKPVYAEDSETLPVACIYDHGVFKTSSGTEFKGFGAKKKCFDLERKELIERDCVSGSGSVSNDPQGHFTVECDPVQQ